MDILEIDDKSFPVFQISKNLTKKKFIEKNEKFQKTIKDYTKNHLLSTDRNHRLIVLCKDSKKITNPELKRKLDFEISFIEIISSKCFETITENLGKENAIFFSFPRY